MFNIQPPLWPRNWDHLLPRSKQLSEEWTEIKYNMAMFIKKRLFAFSPRCSCASNTPDRHKRGVRRRVSHSCSAQPLPTVQSSLSKAHSFTGKLLSFPERQCFVFPNLKSFWEISKAKETQNFSGKVHFSGPSSDLCAFSLVCAERLSALGLNGDKYQCPNLVVLHSVLVVPPRNRCHVG